MSLEENKAMIHSFTKALNNQNLSSLDGLMTPDYVEHTLQLKGYENWKHYVTKFLKAFPDLNVTIEDIIAEGDKVWTSVKITGTHMVEFRGIAPTGKTINPQTTKEIQKALFFCLKLEFSFLHASTFGSQQNQNFSTKSKNTPAKYA